MNTQDKSEINIGLDTGQAILDIHVRPQGHFQSLENNPEGIRAAIRFIKPFRPTRILIEATGQLEMAFLCATPKSGIPVCVCNPILSTWLYETKNPGKKLMQTGCNPATNQLSSEILSTIPFYLLG